jgi:hypothetical protein
METSGKPLSGNSVQWLFSIGPASRPRSAVGRWQEWTGYFWIVVSTVVMIGSFFPPLLVPFVGVPFGEIVGWTRTRDEGYNYICLYGFDGAFRIGFMYIVLGRAEVESFLFSSTFMRAAIIGPFVAVLAWLGVLFLGVAGLIVFMDILTPFTALILWEQTRYKERFRLDKPDKVWWKVWLSLPQSDYRRSKISHVIEYESVLQSAYFLVCMVFPGIMYAATGFFEAKYELGLLSATAGLLFVSAGLTPIVVSRSGDLYGGNGIWIARYIVWLRWVSLACGFGLCAVGLLPWKSWLILQWVNMAGLIVTTAYYLREPLRDNLVAATQPS